MTMQKLNNGVSFFTKSCTSGSFENRAGYSFRVIIKTEDRNSPINMELITATTRENNAVLG